MEEKKYLFKTKKYPFKKILEELFEIKDLSLLHTYEKINDERLNTNDLGKDSQSDLHNVFYKAIKTTSSDIRKLWEDFLAFEVRNHFKEEKTLIVQSLPSIRIQIPGAKAIQRWHYDSDKDHKHPKGEINCLLPITSMRGSNSLWRESSPFKGDYKPFELEEGEMIYWNGNECHHGNKVNKTCHTRVSFDFRVMPSECYLKNIVNVKEDKRNVSATRGTKFIIGSYYKELI